MKDPLKEISNRYGIIAIFILLLGVLVLKSAWTLMTDEKDYWMEVAARFVKEDTKLPPTRGNILAEGGEILASSLPEYKLFIDFEAPKERTPEKQQKAQHVSDSVFLSKIDSVCTGMHSIFPDIDPVKLKGHLMQGFKKRTKRGGRMRHWPIYPKRISYIQYLQVKALPLFNKKPRRGGFHTEIIKSRKNPYGNLAIATIGGLYKGYADSARRGIELSYDSVLRGIPGVAHREKMRDSYISIVEKPAVDGSDVMLTLNVQMQDIVEKALTDKLKEIEAREGLCILMEVATGDIKAMSSMRRQSDGSYLELAPDAVSNLYEPGSVFKPMSFLVAFDDGYIHMDDIVDVGCGIKKMYGRNMRDANWRSGGSGVVTVPQILQKSLNVGVSTLIDRHYHKQPRKFVEGIYRIGVAEDLKIPLREYRKPRIRMPGDPGVRWSDTALPWMSIGYETQVPPITTVTFYNGIANNGTLLRPRLVKAILRNGEVVQEFPPVVLRDQMAHPDAIKNIQDCLESVVTQGLGKKARSKQFISAGKTGTAQIWAGGGFTSEYLISFAGYFPSRNPQYSCIVCFRKGSPASGGGMCAPVFREVAEKVMALRHTTDYASAKDTVHTINPELTNGNLSATAQVLQSLDLTYQTTETIDHNGITWGEALNQNNHLQFAPHNVTKGNTLPDLTGYGVRDALFLLESMGLKVKINGHGYVTHQSPKAGHTFEVGETVELTLKLPDHKRQKPRHHQVQPVVATSDSTHAAPSPAPTLSH